MSAPGLSDTTWDELRVSRESRSRLTAFVDLALTWQARINLISPSTIPQIWQRHVLDSLQLLKYAPVSLTAFADLGTGSGFPALPVAIATGATVHMYESNGKKAAFLREALRHTRTHGQVHHMRLENIASPLPDVQLVTARALAPLPLLLDLAKPFLDKGIPGLFHKGQDVDAELTQASKCWRIKAETYRSSSDSPGVILHIKEALHV